MLINVSFNITPFNQIKISRYLDSLNWRISHITKRPVKKRLEFPQERIDILTGNIRSNENPLNIRYGDSFLLDFQCNLINDSIRVSVNPSDHCQSALDGWISSAVWSFTLAEAPLWPEVVKSLQNVTWPICSVTIDTDDLHCRVGGIMRQSMSDINGFFCINEAAQTVNWNVTQVFPPRPPPPSHSPPPPPRPGLRHTGTSSGSNGRARGRGRVRIFPGGRPHARGFGPRYRRDQLAEIARRLFDQSSHDQSSNEYDSLTPGHQTPPRSSPPRHSTPPPSQPPPQRGSSPVVLDGQTQANLLGAHGALQAIYGPGYDIADMIQGIQLLELRHRSPPPIHTIEPEDVESAQNVINEELWHRDVSGRLARGQTGGSDEQHNLE